MRFRLTYTGPLKAHRVPKEGAPNLLPAHKHDLRRHFHRQLARLWRTNPFLREHESYPSDYGLGVEHHGVRRPLAEIVALLHRAGGFNFVPLVREDWSLECEISLLMLRHDQPGSNLVHRGDIDNRVKTLLDALRCPLTTAELAEASPKEGEDPFFVLLEDDRLVTALSLETGVLLDPDVPEDHVALLLDVEVRPYRMTSFNLSFG